MEFIKIVSPELYAEINARGFLLKTSDGDVAEGESLELRKDSLRINFDTGFKDFPHDTPMSMEGEELTLMPENADVEYAVSMKPEGTQ